MSVLQLFLENSPQCGILCLDNEVVFEHNFVYLFNFAKMKAKGSAEGPIATDALVAWMACEGLVLLELLGLHRFDQTTKDAFFSRLKAIAAADNGEAS